MNAFDYFFEKSSLLEKDFVVGNETLSFNNFYHKSIALSQFINREIGVNKNIILIAPNSVYFLIVYMAIIKSCNICIPLDPMIENESFKYIRDITGASMFFITDDVGTRLAIPSESSFTPDTLPSLSWKVKNTPVQSFDGNRSAEIIFTSGSTGKPKGVMISHNNLISNTNSIIEYLELNENDRMLCVLPLYYCYGLSLLHTHLRVGGSMVFNNSFIFLGTILNDLLNHACTGFAGVPSHYQILLRKSDSFKRTRFPDLRYVTQAGGKLAPVFIDEFREFHPNIKFWVMYGQTEATARLSYLNPDLYEFKKGSIGKSIPGVNIKVVNVKGLQVKPGEVGEVIAKGDNIMMGYFDDEVGTKNTIKNNWLFTGDLGTIDEDGFIYLTARKKEIIKVGGKRISPKEIEAVILEIPEVIDCLIEGVEDELQGESIKATIIIDDNEKKAEVLEKIQQHCYKNLELYKMPHIFEFNSKMVISPTGKNIKRNF